MANVPLVSVIIPTYNRAYLIANAINSVKAQTHPNIQLIVVDDGSVDNTKELIATFSGIEYYYKENGGQGSARNYGLQYVKGKYIATLDSDDQWYPEFVEEQLEHLEKDELDFTFTNWYQETKSGIPVSFLKDFSQTITYFDKNDENKWVNLSYEELRKMFVHACVAPSSGLLIRRTSHQKPWNENMNIADDWCMLLDIITAKPCKAAFTFKKLWFKRINTNNIYDSRNYKEISQLLYVDDFNNIINRFKSVFTKEEIKVFENMYVKSLIYLTSVNVRSLKWENQKKAFHLLIMAVANNTPMVFMHYSLKLKKVLKNRVKKYSRMVKGRLIPKLAIK